jgi:hypothetical protein
MHADIQTSPFAGTTLSKICGEQDQENELLCVNRLMEASIF